MANIIRTPKSGNHWTGIELKAYNISIQNLPAKNFFNQDLPDSLHMTFKYLDLATRVNSAIDDFAKGLLRMLGFEERNHVLRSRYPIPLTICGDSSRTAQSDICLIHHHQSTILLLIKEDKTLLGPTDPEPQVIAEAIATFQMNNRNRTRRGLQTKKIMSIPCIMIVGTRPIFYVVPVTEQLSEAVEQGQYPEHKTQVLRYVVGAGTRLTEGMEQPDLNEEALKHYVLFRSFAKRLWSELLSE
ncbi:hypothetical protein GYMLUDRAFT_73383 [Collybiopsis luxurians FD-317 M1]|uniref:Uncharacterized protein n=1 Tax=Collybiopsis luxurians FD-317 M1 TaxID=944289 RepID=A0A0D0CYF3_9AGAR|nr:hypothetical protein GYMLUDRAFT_73383 [Collybiopsis luxurians FD-317 M1]